MFSGGVTIAATFLSALLPSLRMVLRQSIVPLGSGRSSGKEFSRPFWRMIVGVEVALALVLTAGMGLLVKSMDRIVAERVGFQTDHVLTAAFTLPAGKIQTPEEGAVLYERLLGEVRAIPGISVIAARLAESPLYRVPFADPAIHGGVALALLLAASAAAWFPARRALRVDPVRVLHEE